MKDQQMCMSAQVSFGAAATLLSAGALATRRAASTDQRYTALCFLPLLFGLQQFAEGMVWVTGANGDADSVRIWSLIYMFFSWLTWPVWVPVSVYFIEHKSRKVFFLIFAILGGMLGALQFVPYFAHDGWLTTTFLARAIVYQGTELLDFVTGRTPTYIVYLFVLIGPLLLCRDRDVKIFGVLVAGVVAVTYLFFSYAYISVFCFGGALMSLYLVFMIFRKTPVEKPSGNSPDEGFDATEDARKTSFKISEMPSR